MEIGPLLHDVLNFLYLILFWDLWVQKLLIDCTLHTGKGSFNMLQSWNSSTLLPYDVLYVHPLPSNTSSRPHQTPYHGSLGRSLTWTASLTRSCPTEPSWTPTTLASPTPCTETGGSTLLTSLTTTNSRLRPLPWRCVVQLTAAAMKMYWFYLYIIYKLCIISIILVAYIYLLLYV